MRGVGVLITSVCFVAACSFTPAPITTDAGDPPGDGAVDSSGDSSVPDASVDAPAEPPTVLAITPMIGSVEGGTPVMIQGAGFAADAAVAIGGVACAPVTVVSSSLLACTTGDSHFVEGARDVVVENVDGAAATLAAAFTYECPWMTSSGRRTCGAVPPKLRFAPPMVAAWITQFQSGHAFIAAGSPNAADNLNDPTSAVLGTQSAVIETDGAGTSRALVATGLAPIDFTNHVPLLWVKVENVTSASTLQLVLGDNNFANAYRFSFHSTQGQRWTTNGDWVALTMSWSPANVTVVGTPNRAAITDVQLRVVDNATGNHVRLRVNGIALVPEPTAKYPAGVASITFDDNFASMVSAGLPVLATKNFPATAYVIVDLVGDAGRASLADLHALQTSHGWDIAAHAYSDQNHAARFPNLSAQVLEDDLVDSRAWLIANGFRGYDHCAYPGGDFSGGTDVLAVVRTYFATCRTIYQGERETYPPADAAKLRVLYVTNGVTLAQALAAVDHAREHREWIILVFHALVATPTASTQWAATDFAALVDHIATTGIAVKTVRQVLEQ